MMHLAPVNKKLIRTAGYVRVSHEEQKKHGFSVSAQIEGLQKYADENGYFIVDWYIDEGFSARKKSKTRKELTRLVSDAKERKFEMIIFKCIDRWFRNIGEYYKIQEILEDNKINWECSEEEYDTTTREGRLKLNLYLMLAQDEADRGSERITYVFDNKIKNGEAIFGEPSLPFGFKIEVINDIKRVAVDEEKRPIVDEIFSLYEIYKSKYKVLELINKKYDLNFTYKIITTMFNASFYCGMYRDNYNYVYGTPHLSVERWDNIQRILKSNNLFHNTKWSYLFSCLVKCQKCGSTLSGQSTPRNNNVWVYYRCNKKYLKHECDVVRNVHEPKLEKALLENIKPYLENYVAEFEVKSKKIFKPKLDIKKLRAEQTRLNNMYKKDRISEKEYDEEYQAIEDKIKKANDIDFKPVNLSYIKDILESNLEVIYNNLSREEKMLFWRSFLKSVTVDHDTYEILELNLL